MTCKLSLKYQRFAASRLVRQTSFKSEQRALVDRINACARRADKLVLQMEKAIVLNSPDGAQDFAFEAAELIKELRNKARRCISTQARKNAAVRARRSAKVLAAYLKAVQQIPLQQPLVRTTIRVSVPGSHAEPRQPVDIDLPDLDAPAQDVPLPVPLPVIHLPPPPDVPPPMNSDHAVLMAALAASGDLKFYRDAQNAYQQSYMSKGTGAVTRQKYARSAKGQAARKRYAASEKGKAARARYAQSEKGKQALQAAQARYRTKKQQVVK